VRNGQPVRIERSPGGWAGAVGFYEGEPYDGYVTIRVSTGSHFTTTTERREDVQPGRFDDGEFIPDEP
jgi:hypothetical protein